MAVAFLDLVVERWSERTEILLRNTLNQDRIGQSMNQPPLVSPIKALEIRDFIRQLKYPKHSEKEKQEKKKK